MRVNGEEIGKREGSVKRGNFFSRKYLQNCLPKTSHKKSPRRGRGHRWGRVSVVLSPIVKVYYLIIVSPGRGVLVK